MDKEEKEPKRKIWAKRNNHPLGNTWTITKAQNLVPEKVQFSEVEFREFLRENIDVETVLAYE